MTPTSAASLLQVIGAGPAAHHPSAVHCYVGRAAEDLDFSGLDGVVPAQVSIRWVRGRGRGSGSGSGRGRGSGRGSGRVGVGVGVGVRVVGQG